MNYSVKREISKSYEFDRDNAKKRKKENIIILYKKYPILKDLDEKIKYQGIILSKSALYRDNAQMESATQLLSTYKKQKDNFLKENNIYNIYYYEDYKCELCKDTGFISRDNQQLKCNCRIQKIIDSTTDSQLLKLTDINNFDMYNANEFTDKINKQKYGISISPRENIEINRKISMEFIRNFNSKNQKNLLFSGQSGLGKTFLASCIAKEILEENYTVIFQSSPILFDTILKLKYNFDKEITFDITYNDILNVNLLIIDDLGTDSLTQNKLAELLNILNTRKARDMYKPCKTIISTNITNMKILEHNFKERIFSRIVGDFEFLRFAGDDLRIKKATT